MDAEVKNANEYGYFVKETLTELEITSSTLRRWSIALEDQGYKFTRNERNQRIYYERDYKAISHLKKLLSNGVPYTDAIDAVVATDWFNHDGVRTVSVRDDAGRLTRSDLQLSLLV